jgi:NACalpha-BTF3-like transcription factor
MGKKVIDVENMKGVDKTITQNPNEIDVIIDEPTAKPRKIYQILSGLTEEEFYTFSPPAFSADFDTLLCLSVYSKKTITQKIANKTITAYYSHFSDVEKSFKLSNAVLIKSFNVESVIDWIYKNEDEAKNELKERELEVYRELIPILLERTQYPSNTTTETNSTASQTKSFLL